MATSTRGNDSPSVRRAGRPDGADDAIVQHVQRLATGPVSAVLARCGLAARGLVYLCMGLLSLLVAVDAARRPVDGAGVLRFLDAPPSGPPILAVVTVGLAGYALYNFLRAVFDTESEGTGPAGLFTRLGYLVVSGSYVGLAWGAFGLATGLGRGGSGSDVEARGWTARALAVPFGDAAVLALGLILIGVALAQTYQAYTLAFARRLRLDALPIAMARTIELLGRVAVVARAAILAILGFFLARAALTDNARLARGMSGVLRIIAQRQFGHLFIGAVALGFVAYGIYSLIEVRYRDIGMRAGQG